MVMERELPFASVHLLDARQARLFALHAPRRVYANNTLFSVRVGENLIEGWRTRVRRCLHEPQAFEFRFETSFFFLGGSSALEFPSIS
jgi:hypothetical protein